jgi:RNase P protein component
VIFRRQVRKSYQETAERLVIEGDVVVITNRAASRSRHHDPDRESGTSQTASSPDWTSLQ